MSQVALRRAKLTGGRRRAFTLIEMLLVMALAATLMTMLAGSLIQARNRARKTKAEAQLREMVNAYIQYFNTYGQWPANIEGTDVRVSESMLQPLIDPTANTLGIVFLNKTFTPVERRRSQKLHGGTFYLDPWSTPYRMSFGTVVSDKSEAQNKISHTTSVFFPNKSRRW